jgi:hypothetical protein
VRAANGEPDLTPARRARGFDDALLRPVRLRPRRARRQPGARGRHLRRAADGGRVALRVLGIDALQVAPLAAALLPQPAEGQDRLAVLDPGAVLPTRPHASAGPGRRRPPARCRPARPGTTLRVAGTWPPPAAAGW